MMDDTMTARQRVFDCICDLLPRVLGREIAAIGTGTNLMGELGMRSASMLELLLELEVALDIQIDVEDIDETSMQSAGDLADFVAAHSAAAE